MKTVSALRYATIKSKSENVKDWVSAQTKLYGSLEELGKANILLKSVINESYDELCTKKKDIDCQIVEHYYDEGHDFLDDFTMKEKIKRLG